MLDINKLSKNYHEIIALDDLTFNVGKGEIFGLLGPNGAGKSTALKIISGLILADSGDIKINNQIFNRDNLEIKKQISYVPDEPFLYSKLTGQEHMHFYADLYKIPHSIRTQKINFFFDYFDFNEYKDKLTETYSTGTKQKLLISQALLVEPKILLLDEPLISIDPLVSKKFKEHLIKTATNGTVILFATHILPLALEVCNRIGIIIKGKIVKIIESQELDTLKNSKDLETYYYNTVIKHV